MAELVREITQFGRPTTLRRVPISLNGLVESCLDLAQARAQDRKVGLPWISTRPCPRPCSMPASCARSF
jgi:hypothetical protein